MDGWIAHSEKLEAESDWKKRKRRKKRGPGQCLPIAGVLGREKESHFQAWVLVQRERCVKKGSCCPNP